MALIRSISTEHGNDVEYWRIEKIEDDLAARRLDFILRGYMNEAARRAGCDFIYECPLVLVDEAYEPAPGLGVLYERVKLYPLFTEAKDG